MLLFSNLSFLRRSTLAIASHQGWPIAIAALCLLLIQPLSAEVTARVAGTVKDPSGSVVAGVSVTAQNTETGVKQTTVTDEAGFYAFPALAVGHYELNVRQRGFKDYRQTGLTLDVNTALRIDVTLELGSQTE